MAKGSGEPNFLLGTLVFFTICASSIACPHSCYCFDAFVTCSDFKSLNLTELPPATDTLVISRGEMEEIPPGFLAMATNLKMLEVSSLSVKVVRSKAFSDLRELDVFSITSSFFGLVEAESFSGMTEVGKFHISESAFGKVDKHAFAHIDNIADFKIWSSNFEVIADEVFYQLTDVVSIQIYQNNITSLGSQLFLGSSGIDDITIYKNTIHTMSEESLDKVTEITGRLVLYANTFSCSCDIAWILDDPVLKEYLASNECVFPISSQNGESKFRMADVTRDELCPAALEKEIIASSTPALSPVLPEIREEIYAIDEELYPDLDFAKSTSVPTSETTTYHSSTPKASIKMADHQASTGFVSLSPSAAAVETTSSSSVYLQSSAESITEDYSSASFSPEKDYIASTSFRSDNTFSTSESSEKLSSTLPEETKSSQISVEVESARQISVEVESAPFKTDPELFETTEIGYYELLTTSPPQAITERNSLREITEPPITDELAQISDLTVEERVKPVHEASIDVQGHDSVRPSNNVTTLDLENESNAVHADPLFICLISGLVLLISALRT